MEIKYIRHSHRSQAFSRACPNSQNRPGCQLAHVSFCQPSAENHEEIQDKRGDIHRAPAVLDHQRYPGYARHALEEGAIAEEVGGAGDPVGQRSVSTLFEIRGDFDHCNGGARGHKVAHYHGEGDQGGDIDFVWSGPIRVSHDSRHAGWRWDGVTIVEDRSGRDLVPE